MTAVAASTKSDQREAGVVASANLAGGLALTGKAAANCAGKGTKWFIEY